jgi:hypothetical protein
MLFKLMFLMLLKFKNQDFSDFSLIFAYFLKYLRIKI